LTLSLSLFFLSHTNNVVFYTILFDDGKFKVFSGMRELRSVNQTQFHKLSDVTVNMNLEAVDRDAYYRGKVQAITTEKPTLPKGAGATRSAAQLQKAATVFASYFSPALTFPLLTVPPPLLSQKIRRRRGFSRTPAGPRTTP